MLYINFKILIQIVVEMKILCKLNIQKKQYNNYKEN